MVKKITVYYLKIGSKLSLMGNFYLYVVKIKFVNAVYGTSK